MFGFPKKGAKDERTDRTGKAGESGPEKASETVPAHVAVIMDGNGRWATARGKKREFGHKAGSENVDRITRHAFFKGVKTLTLYAFSAENWSRPKEEVEKLFSILSSFLKSRTKELVKEKVRLTVSGEREGLSPALQKQIAQTEERTAAGDVTLNLCINYGGRQEIARAATLAAKDGLPVTEESIKKYLYTAPFGDPDLIIRTGGEERLSNFLLFQAAYSEFYFTPVFWPDFNEEEFDKALRSFAGRKRRFGGIDE